MVTAEPLDSRCSVPTQEMVYTFIDARRGDLRCIGHPCSRNGGVPRRLWKLLNDPIYAGRFGLFTADWRDGGRSVHQAHGGAPWTQRWLSPWKIFATPAK